MQLITNSPTVVILSELDSVAVARRALAGGSRVESLGLDALNDIPAGHKIACRAIASGQPVLKYGQVIGIASRDIAAGEHVHTHNVVMPQSHANNELPPPIARTPVLPPEQRRRFMGYRRPDGRVGTRNYIGILSTVNCSATVSRAVAAHFNGSELLKRYNIDGVVALTHGSGCAIDTWGLRPSLITCLLLNSASILSLGASSWTFPLLFLQGPLAISLTAMAHIGVSKIALSKRKASLLSLFSSSSFVCGAGIVPQAMGALQDLRLQTAGFFTLALITFSAGIVCFSRNLWKQEISL